MPLQKVKCTNYMGIMDVSVKYVMQLNFKQLGMASLFEALWESPFGRAPLGTQLGRTNDEKHADAMRADQS